MSFSPGQFITAQRLNRLQSKFYFAVAAGSQSSGTTVTGTATAITVETDGATAAVSWTAAVYSTSSGVMSSNTNTKVQYDLATSPTFALAQMTGTSEKVTAANFWAATIPTAGTYTWQLIPSFTGATLSTYTSMMIQITEVA